MTFKARITQPRPIPVEVIKTGQNYCKMAKQMQKQAKRLTTENSKDKDTTNTAKHSHALQK